MSTNVDLLIVHARQLATCAAPEGPKRGIDLLDVGLIVDGAVAIDDGLVVDVGRTDDLLAAYTARRLLDVNGKVICPGFVDCHTHVVYAGDRIDEFELRIRGKSYLEIMAAGGGIVSTMQATRAAGVDGLVTAARPRLATMLRLGTTTAEIKSGYGLNIAGELAMLTAADILAEESPLDIVPTLLAAHAVPPEFASDPQGYVDFIVDELMPQVIAWYSGSGFGQRGTLLCNDVFCEANAFDVAQSRQILAAGMRLGLPAKIHVDEFTALGGLTMAVTLGALSADHLDVTAGDELTTLAGSDTVGVVLPAVNLNLGSTHFADARRMIDAGAAIALATDVNPGSAPCLAMPLIMALACRYQRLLPAEALNAATVNAAYAIGLGDRVGSLENGKQADLLIVDAPDFHYLAYEFGHNLVATVVKRGRIVAG